MRIAALISALSVAVLAAPAFAGPGDAPGSLTYWRVDEIPQLGNMHESIATTLLANRIEYPGKSGNVEAFWAGDAYHGVFSRDMATIAPFARYMFTPNHARTPAEEFLYLQSNNPIDAGALPGVFTPGAGNDKATVTSDEDFSVIHLAYTFFQNDGGSQWLQRNIGGQSVIQRLNGSMDYVWRNRTDPASGLIKRGNTTDWGDVKLDGGPNPTDMAPGDAWYLTVYDQAHAFGALLELAAMNDAAGRPDISAELRGRASAVRDRTNAIMWQSQRGFYRPRVAVGGQGVAVNDDAVLGAGNIEAVRFGLADVEQARLIFQVFERAKAAAGAQKVGLVAWPPYPEGTAGGMMPGEYQNGGIWDWWGGRQIETEFKAGQSQLAYKHLVGLAQEWATRPGEVWEWQELWSGKVRGSSRYTGAAATVGNAIVEGLFGIDLGRDGFTLTPRLAGRSGAIFAQHPGTGRQMQLELGGIIDGTVLVRYGTTYLGSGTLRYLLPADKRSIQLTIDGLPVPSGEETIGDDRYLVATVPGGSHQLTIRVVDY